MAKTQTDIDISGPAKEPEERIEDETESSRNMDPEVKVLGALLRLLNKLDPECRARQVAWLASRFKEKP